MEDGEGVVVVSAWYECVSSRRGSGIVSSAADVQGMSVVRSMTGVGGVCEMCMCLARCGVGGERVSGYELNARIDLIGFRQRSSGDKSVGCVVQANRCLTSCGEVSQSVQMSFGSPNTICL